MDFPFFVSDAALSQAALYGLVDSSILPVSRAPTNDMCELRHDGSIAQSVITSVCATTMNVHHYSPDQSPSWAILKDCYVLKGCLDLLLSPKLSL